MMGDYIGYTLEACQRKGVSRLALSGQFAKLLKIACGHPQTHVRHSQLDLTLLLQWAKEIDLDADEYQQLKSANTARQVFEQFGPRSALIERIGDQALEICQQQVPETQVSILLVNYQGQVAKVFACNRVP